MWRGIVPDPGLYYIHVYLSSTAKCLKWWASRDVSVINHDLGAMRWGYFMSQPANRQNNG